MRIIKPILLIIFILYDNIILSQYVFNKMYDYANWIDGGAVICQDDDGVFYIGGRAFPLDLNAPDYGATYDSTFIYKVESNGKLLDIYKYSFFDNIGEYSEGIIVKGDSLIMALTKGNFEIGDDLKFAFISKNDGILLDTISIPSTGANYSTRDFIRARDGGFLGCGWKGYAPESNVMKTIVYKLAESGELEWMREFKHPDFERQLGESLIEDNNGLIYIGCPLVSDALNPERSWSLLKLDHSGDSISQAIFFNDLNQGRTNNVFINANNILILNGSFNGDSKILELSNDLELLAEHTYASEYTNFELESLFEVENGYFGTLRLDISVPDDPYKNRMGLAKFDSDFNMLWYKVYSGMEGQDDQYYYDAVQTSDGGIAMCGFIITGTEEVNNMWLVKIDSLGNDTLPLSNILPEQLFLYPNEDTVITALTYGGSNCYQNYEWLGSGGLPFFMDPVDSMQCHLIAPNEGDYELIYYVEDITGVPLWDTCHISIIPTSISGSAFSLQASQVLVAPNPAREKFYLTLQDKTIRPQWIKLYTTDGREVMKLDYSEEVAIHSLSAGLYFIAVGGNGFSYYAKVVVTKE